MYWKQQTIALLYMIMSTTYLQLLLLLKKKNKKKHEKQAALDGTVEHSCSLLGLSHLQNNKAF